MSTALTPFRFADQPVQVVTDEHGGGPVIHQPACPFPLRVDHTWRHTCKQQFWQPIPASRLALDALHRPIGGAR